jgi:hypothetical protein
MQSVRFDEDFSLRDLRLFEVPDSFVKFVIQNEGNPILLGMPDQRETALCTNSSTYSLKKVETSNHVFVLQRENLLAACPYYYELSPITPSLTTAAKVSLKKTEFKGTKEEIDSPPTPEDLITKIELQAMIRASSVEMEELIKAAGVIELGGFMRAISPRARLQVTEALFDAIIEHGWSIGALEEGTCCVVLAEQGLDDTLVRHVLDQHGSVDYSTRVWHLSHEKVCKSAARLLLEAESHFRVWPLGEFCDLWRARSPDSANCPISIDYLKGVAVVMNGGLGLKYADVEAFPAETKVLI